MLFSIIIPTYNRAFILSKVLHRVCAQSWSNFECIIVDDGSTDNTQAIVNEIDDARIRYFKKENGERGAARNFGALQANGQYLNFLDSDDFLYPNHLEEAKKFIDEQETPEIFFQHYDYQNEHGEKKPTSIRIGPYPLDSLAWMNVMIPSATFVQRSIFLKFPFNEDRDFNLAEDLYVWMRIGSRYTIKYNNKTTLALTQHANRSMANPSVEKIEYCKNKICTLLQEDPEFMVNGKPLLRQLEATHISLMALSHVLNGQKKPAITELVRAIRLSSKELFRKRTWAVIKRVLTPNLLT